MSKELFKAMAKMPAMRASFQRDPLLALDVYEKRFGTDFGPLTPADVEILASLSKEEFALLEKINEKFEAYGDLPDARDTGNLYY